MGFLNEIEDINIKKLFSHFFDKNKLKILKSSKINNFIFVFDTSNSSNEELSLIKILKNYLANHNYYFIDNNDIQLFHPNMDEIKMLQILETIKNLEKDNEI